MSLIMHNYAYDGMQFLFGNSVFPISTHRPLTYEGVKIHCAFSKYFPFHWEAFEKNTYLREAFTGGPPMA